MYSKKEMYVTVVDNADTIWKDRSKTDWRPFHRSKVIVHRDWMWYFAEFPTDEAFKKWCEYCGVEISLEEEKEALNKECGTWKRYSVNIGIDDSNSFWSLDEIPKGAKSITLLSNGRLVTGYILNDGNILHVYRPNPNAKDVYNPLPVDEDIAYRLAHGFM